MWDTALVSPIPRPPPVLEMRLVMVAFHLLWCVEQVQQWGHQVLDRQPVWLVLVDVIVEGGELLGREYRAGNLIHHPFAWDRSVLLLQHHLCAHTLCENLSFEKEREAGESRKAGSRNEWKKEWAERERDVEKKGLIVATYSFYENTAVLRMTWLFSKLGD